MDERRDLVDRNELRRRIAEDPFSASEVWEMHLDAMPSVECPRGWTRDEVLAELDAAEQRGDKAVCEVLGVLNGEWYLVPRWAVEAWHPEVRRYDVRVEVVAPEPEWVPLTQLVGRTLMGETAPVASVDATMTDESIVTLTVTDTPDGPMVAVRPKATT